MPIRLESSEYSEELQKNLKMIFAAELSRMFCDREQPRQIQFFPSLISVHFLVRAIRLMSAICFTEIFRGSHDS